MRNYTHLNLNNTLLNKIQEHCISKWLVRKKKDFFDYQLLAFNAINSGNDVLINAPTGSGKTLAALLAPIINFEDDIKSGELSTIYISPLKSLIYDIKRNLELSINEIGLDINIETRTGDTSNYQKSKQLKKAPNFLVTTPESFALLMSYENADKYFTNVKYIVMDELHNIIYTKRGDLLLLNIARLKNIVPQAVKIALSATIHETDKALDYISNSKNKTCINPKISKKINLKIIKTRKPIPWSGHMAFYAIEEIYNIIKSYKSTIIFVNTRAQSEYIFQNLWKINNEKLKICVHHGSLDRKIRQEIEHKMFNSKINCVVATSSLELGIDWGDVELVIQVGAPKGLSRIIQRIGRSNHNLNEASNAILVPTNKFEYLECLAAQEALKKTNIETFKEKEGSLDVLAQHINGVACSKKFKPNDLFKEIKEAWPYRNLNKKDFDNILNFVENGGYILKNYTRFCRLKKNKNIYNIANNSFRIKYRMNIGTIVESELVPVFMKNKKLGNIEEYFINQLQKNDTFLFAGLILKFNNISQRGVEVIKTTYKDPKIPSYVGGNLPLSSFLADNVIKIINSFNKFDIPDQIRNWLMIQKKVSSLPPKKGLLLETFCRNKYNYIIAYTFQGRSANQTLGILIMKHLEDMQCKPIAFTATDYAIAVWTLKNYENPPNIFKERLLSVELNNWIKNTSILKKHFKKIAVISGLIDRRGVGYHKSYNQVNFNSDLIYDVLEKYDKKHILIKITKDEAMKELINIDALKSFIVGAKNNIIHKKLSKISPFAASIIMEFYTDTISKDKIIKYKEEILEDQLIGEALKK